MEGRFGEFGGEMPTFTNTDFPGETMFTDRGTKIPEFNDRSGENGLDIDINEAIFERVKRLPMSIFDSNYLKSEAVEKIASDLNIRDSSLKRFIGVEVGMMAQIQRVERIVSLKRNTGNLSGNRKFHELLLKNAGYFQEVAGEIKKDPDKNKILWDHHRRLHEYEGKKHLGEKSGILAVIGVEDVITKDLHADFKEASVEKDVSEATDGLITILNEKGEKEEIPCQIKSIYSKNSNNERFDFVKKHMVTVIHRSLGERIKNKETGFSEGVYSRKSPFIKEKEKELRGITDRIFSNNTNERAVVLYIPSGNIEVDGKITPALNDDGTMNEKIKEMFLEQFNEKVLGIKNPEVDLNIDNQKINDKDKRRRKK